MRILHIIPNLNKGGAERLVVNICQELTRLPDIKVKLINFRPDNEYDFLLKGIDREVIPSKVIPSILNKTQVNVTALQKEIESFSPDIIHSHLLESEIVLSEINYPSAKYFFHFHDNMRQFSGINKFKKGLKTTITEQFEKRKLLKVYKRRQTQAIAISKDTFNFAKSNLPPTIKITHLPNAISFNQFQAPVTTKKEKRAVIIGSLVSKKGHKLALQVIQALKEQHVFMHLDILGDGPLKKELHEQAKNCGIKELVHFHGNVDYPEIFLKKATIYLHTAIYEPFGLVLLEAMAAGLPVVCTDGFGNRDLINNGENGYLFPDRSPKAIADKITSLLENPDICSKMGESAKEFSKQFDIKPYVSQLLKLYRES
ncbi:MAG: glycosyltransferase family 4 protein [Crocinitomicaceae bacterium]|nr:glycosyltransferase family 4 protein [Crocinitomicaceae bacterium]